MIRLAARVASIFLVLFCGVVNGAEILDDSPSPVQQLRLQFEWLEERALEIGNQPDNQMVGHLHRVDVRLDTSSYVGERAKIYLRLPRLTEGAIADSELRVSWETDGFFNSGEVSPGTRALLYEGVVTDSITRELFDFTIYFRAWIMSDSLRILPVYEIERF